MKISLTQKERTLLEDQKHHEEICVKKYDHYAQQAHDQELAQMFSSFSAQEQEHLNTINQMLSGQVPNMQQQNQQNQQQQMQSSASAGKVSANQELSDAFLCTDMLMTEKYVSSTYDIAVFEFTDPNARQALNHLQQEEQQHGEGIFHYMSKNGMYNPQ